MNDITKVIYDNKVTVRLSGVAKLLGTNESSLKNNFSRNKDKFIEGKDYYQLTHEQAVNLRVSLGYPLEPPIYTGRSGMKLWTESGLAMHAKLVLTSYAWGVQRSLVDDFFDKQPKFPQLPQTYVQALRQLADTTEEKEKALATIKNKDELLKLSNDFIIKVGEIRVREFVKSADGINIGTNNFCEWMRQEGYIFKNDKNKNQPMQKFVNKGWFTYRASAEKHNGKFRHSLYITPKGEIALAKVYKDYLKKNEESYDFD